ncbi:MAG: galactokinase, partial [Acidobacteriota bacterium]
MRKSTQGLARRVRRQFHDLFGDGREPRVAVAPGRVNLIGGHTDYNEGLVLPVAIDRHVAVAFGVNEEGRLRAYSKAYRSCREVAVEELGLPGGTEWFDYVAGTAWALKEAGHDVRGVDLVVDGDVPMGAGLSSSAALELATARALAGAAGLPWDPVAMAKLAQRAENDYVGVRCGVMDQIAAAASVEGSAMLLDCRTLEASPIPLPDEATLVVMDTATRRRLAHGAYNERRRSCAAAVEALKGVQESITALRDVNRETLARSEALMKAVTFRRALHVVEEIARTKGMADALLAGDLERSGRLMNESHQSLRDLYQVSSREL